MKRKLKSLKSLNAFDGQNETTEINFQKCDHEPVLISATQARCAKCPAGWQGHDIARLTKTA